MSLTDTERWGFTTADFERCLAIAPDGCFLVQEDGERAGILTTASYGEVAWVGNIIVAPALRGRGLGGAVIVHALDFLDRKGTKAVRLWAYPNTVELYRKFGFRKDEVLSTRMLGFADGHGGREPQPLPAGCQVLPVTPLTWRDTLALDLRSFRSDRSRVIEKIASDPVNPGFLARGASGDVEGYILATLSPKGCEIGPWVVDAAHNLWAAPVLLDRMLHVLAGRSVELGIYGENPRLVDLLHTRGFHAGFVTEQMTRGNPNVGQVDPSSILAVGSLERG